MASSPGTLRLRHCPDGLFLAMRFSLSNGVWLGACLLICAVLAGCAVGVGPYPQTQSIEAAVQSVLAKQGYYQGPIDGTIGATTSRAIRNYQRDHRLTPTGTINPALIASMGLVGPSSVNVGSWPYYTGYPAYNPWYVTPTYYVPPVIGVGWGGGYGGCWNRGWGGYRGWGGGYGGYRGYGVGYGHGWCR